MEFVTINPGKILWHARLQPIYGNRKNVLNSPDYLFMSPQISQSFFHGLEKSKITHNTPVSSRDYIELTKIVVKKPLRLVRFNSAKEQKNFAEVMNIVNNYKTFSYDDLKIIKYICSDTKSIDGYRAHWDQDQIAVCARSIKSKLKILGTYNFDEDTILKNLGINSYQVAFNRTIKPGSAYYVTNNQGRKVGRKVVKVIKSYEKMNAIHRKQERIERLKTPSLKNLTRTEAIKRRERRRLGLVKPMTFKRPALRKKKGI